MERDSNFELLRILCMGGILAGHVLQMLYNINTSDFTVENTFRVLLMNISIISVNCFVFISGYYRIKTRWKGFFNLYTQCAFYAIGFAILSMLTGEGSYIQVFKSVFALSETNLWFIKTYFALFLIAPLLNAGYEKLTGKQRLNVLWLLLIIDVYLGYMHQIPEITVDGYGLVHFICLYYIGAFLSDLKPVEGRKAGIAWLVLIILMTALHAVKMVFPPIAAIYSLRYNSPLVFMASVCFFIWVKKWNFHSKGINWIAGSVLSVYLIHSNPFVWNRLISFLKDLQQIYNSPFITAMLIVIFMVVFYAACILLDKARSYLFNPVNAKLASWTEHISSLISRKQLINNKTGKI